MTIATTISVEEARERTPAGIQRLPEEKPVADALGQVLPQAAQVREAAS